MTIGNNGYTKTNIAPPRWLCEAMAIRNFSLCEKLKISKLLVKVWGMVRVSGIFVFRANFNLDFIF